MKNRIICAFAALLAMATIFVGCRPKKSPIEHIDIVYVAGEEENAAEKNIATLWKNGAPERLTDGNGDARAQSIFVSGDDVYVVGSEDVSGDNDRKKKRVAILWKNGVPTKLTNGNSFAMALSVFVQDDDVYVVGLEYNEVGKSVAMLWKNGEPTPLGSGWEDDTANSIFVSEGDVYVAGYEQKIGMPRGGPCTAVLWKNGVLQRLSDANNSMANSVYVSGSDVYVAGHEWNTEEKKVAILWKNGVPTPLSDANAFAEAHSVFVAGSDVYVVGQLAETEEGHEHAMLWKNGAAQRLSDGNTDTIAKSVFVLGNDVYVSGHEDVYESHDSLGMKRFAILWKNGKPMRLGEGEGDAYGIRAILVK
ncbi:MAG: hypothetical protein LBC63_09840 [Holophagales bacterium]|jgi:hypothetical protein|nr:hypothetical protein [Holophagales bacterium]